MIFGDRDGEAGVGFAANGQQMATGLPLLEQATRRFFRCLQCVFVSPSPFRLSVGCSPPYPYRGRREKKNRPGVLPGMLHGAVAGP